MRKSVNLFRSINFAFACAVVLATGAIQPADAQQRDSFKERDPFRKPVVATKKSATPPGAAAAKKAEKPVPTIVAAPSIQQRIENYKILRMRAAELGLPAPKPTAVLTVSEVEVTGVFRTPRGYAAMVEAVPIKLSYTIYPGEKFYDGYLVAIEDNRLVFRRETRMTDGKVFTVAENKGLKLQTIDPMLVPRVETAANGKDAATAEAPSVNPTVTVPASTAAMPSSPVQTADNRNKPEVKNAPFAKDETVSAESAPAENKSIAKPARRVNPRKSK